jgi:hypothetical protein
MISWGGNVAEYLLTNRRHQAGSQYDMQSVVNYISYLAPDVEETGAYADWLWYRTKAMLRLPRHWAAVEALANELLEHEYIGGKRARQIIQDAICHERAHTEIVSGPQRR